ncbi:3-deoxy-manno-octulosonate cytidylyltransferase [Marinobacter litoralis]|uniref:3-deoxy-manno-octulosonate cytidylyltransferase n=1 Tax=Marinobacter litoralis TaxID=187981 RepID=A0A3M2R9I4_9GAMM|nr:3-deoxy-manno-octulosonate cytidylyltransferase [Marinobacter litoralis]RMJ01775.1 3-deoxy-manno-octulosonate cytidylyltransferase [Marinobacter litoralis]
MKSVVVIPARYGSSRYPGKPLVELLGKPMILWVAELAAQAVSPENVYVATEDESIAAVVSDAGYNAVMTSDSALTGTDRLAEAASQISADIFVNVQGDEPLVDPKDIVRIIDFKKAHMNKVINGFSVLSEGEDPANVNIPKVIATETGRMVYMSRNPLPGFKDATNKPGNYYKQVCIYAFTGDELAQFANYGRKSDLERCEDIEILRFLELGKDIQMVETQPGSLAVDVPEDVAPVEAALRARIG